MSGLSFSERARLARTSAAEVGRRGVALMLASPLLSWRHGPTRADALTLVPHSLRTADPSFAAEIAQGSFGLAGQHAMTGSFSPFDVPAPSISWSRELHGFSWLRHLEADGSPEASSAAQKLVGGWLDRKQRLPEIARVPEVAARRIISWLAAAPTLLETADTAAFDRTLNSLAGELRFLSATWLTAPVGAPRLTAVIATVYGHLCIAGHETQLEISMGWLAAELNRQILPDGGHVTRNPQVLVDVLLDLLPLRQCFLARQLPVPASVEGAIARMMQMLRHMRLGDGAIARFNGVGATSMVEVTTVLAYDPAPMHQLASSPDSRYARLEANDLVLICDVGHPPALELSSLATAGCLSFELSMASAAVFINGGRPLVATPEGMATSRATASHNTLVLNDKSSAQLVRANQSERQSCDAQMRFPGSVASRIIFDDDIIKLIATHDGYLAEHGVRHTRHFLMAADGTQVEGTDKLHGHRPGQRLARDLPFAIHFHLDPSVDAVIDGDAAVALTLPDGSKARFSANGASLSLEPSQQFAHAAGIARSRQIVLRGATFGETEVTWVLKRLE